MLLFLCSALGSSGIAQTPDNEGQVENNGVTLHYRTFGKNGTYVIVLAGGPGSTVEYMQPFADVLRDKFRVVMLEQRGTGRSKLGKINAEAVKMERYVEDIEALRLHLKTQKVILIGNSWGMMLALLYAAHHPQNVSKAVTVGSAPISDKYAAIFDDNFRMRLLPEEREARREWREKMLKDPTLYIRANYEREKAGTPAYYYDRQIGLKAAAALKEDDLNYQVLDLFFETYEKFDIRPVLKKIISPVLLVQGRQDPAGEANIIEAGQLIRRSKIVFIERCGHLPWEERPDQTLPLVKNFLISQSRLF